MNEHEILVNIIPLTGLGVFFLYVLNKLIDKLLDKVMDYAYKHFLKRIFSKSKKSTEVLRLLRAHIPRLVSLMIIISCVSYFSVRFALNSPMKKLIVLGNVGIGTGYASQKLVVVGAIKTISTGNSSFMSNVGIGTIEPGVLLDLKGGRMRTIGIGTTVPAPSCLKSDGTQGFYNTSTWRGICL